MLWADQKKFPQLTQEYYGSMLAASLIKDAVLLISVMKIKDLSSLFLTASFLIKVAFPHCFGARFQPAPLTGPDYADLSLKSFHWYDPLRNQILDNSLTPIFKLDNFFCIRRCCSNQPNRHPKIQKNTRKYKIKIASFALKYFNSVNTKMNDLMTTSYWTLNSTFENSK